MSRSAENKLSPVGMQRVSPSPSERKPAACKLRRLGFLNCLFRGSRNRKDEWSSVLASLFWKLLRTSCTVTLTCSTVLFVSELQLLSKCGTSLELCVGHQQCLQIHSIFKVQRASSLNATCAQHRSDKQQVFSPPNLLGKEKPSCCVSLTQHLRYQFHIPVILSVFLSFLFCTAVTHFSMLYVMMFGTVTGRDGSVMVSFSISSLG